ncbi:MAG: hypothetical protein A4E25_01443 [Methanobacterium sp. PtaB.Bin024]|nr:MAG: hypothetical protein A4E25_01443 [Methanobacterium sp. PtaB.Bin024]
MVVVGLFVGINSTGGIHDLVVEYLIVGSIVHADSTIIKVVEDYIVRYYIVICKIEFYLRPPCIFIAIIPYSVATDGVIVGIG